MSLAGVLALWALVAFALSVTGWLERFSAVTLLLTGPAVVLAGVPLLYTLSKSFRGYLQSLSLKALTLVQLLRLFGCLALVKAYQDILPALFAVPTGLIDIAIAVSSLRVARRLVSRDGEPLPGFVVWQVLGVFGFALSVILGVLTASDRLGLVRDGITSQSMSLFPMSMVPAFIGPVVLGGHVLATFSARGWKELKPTLSSD